MENNNEPVVIDPSQLSPRQEAFEVETSEPEPVVINPVTEAAEEGGPEFASISPTSRQESFEVGGTEMTLNIDEEGKISACFNEVCEPIGEGEDLFDSLSRLFGQLRQTE